MTIIDPKDRWNDPEARTITVDQAARLLGISRPLAFTMVHQGKLPALRFGHRLVIPKKALQAILGQPSSTQDTTQAYTVRITADIPIRAAPAATRSELQTKAIHQLTNHPHEYPIHVALITPWERPWEALHHKPV